MTEAAGLLVGFCNVNSFQDILFGFGDISEPCRHECVFSDKFSRGKVMANKTGDYEADKQRLKEFLANFAVTDEEGKKTFKYAEQLTAIAHREQTSLTIDLEDVAGVDEDLATAIRENTRRYNLLVAEVVEALLPDYRTRDVPSRDALDVFIKHRQTATERAEALVAPGVQPGLIGTSGGLVPGTLVPTVT